MKENREELGRDLYNLIKGKCDKVCFAEKGIGSTNTTIILNKRGRIDIVAEGSSIFVDLENFGVEMYADGIRFFNDFTSILFTPSRGFNYDVYRGYNKAWTEDDEE